MRGNFKFRPERPEKSIPEPLDLKIFWGACPQTLAARAIASRDLPRLALKSGYGPAERTWDLHACPFLSCHWEIKVEIDNQSREHDICVSHNVSCNAVVIIIIIIIIITTLFKSQIILAEHEFSTNWGDCKSNKSNQINKSNK